MYFFHKHIMKFRNQAGYAQQFMILKLALDIETCIMLSLCLTFQGTGLPV